MAEVSMLGAVTMALARAMPADIVVSIPRYGRVESLNVGVACGILLAHLRSRGPG